MTRIRFAYVDVFARTPLTGNPLVVVPDADDLTADQMRAIAREFNQSETTFLLRPPDERAAWWLRSFTPGGVEVGGAGHNALGAWLWLVAAGRAGSGGTRTLTQRIADEVLAVEIVDRPGGPVRIVMDQGAPQFGAVVADMTELASALGLDLDEVKTVPPPQVVSTGVGHLLVAVTTREAVDRLTVDTRRLLHLLRSAGAEGCYVYTTQPTDPHDDVDAYARFFNPTVGITEDPATGTAAGPLAAYLLRVDPASGPVVVIEQGRAIGRPSRLEVEVIGDRVRLSGSGLVVGEGWLTA